MVPPACRCALCGAPTSPGSVYCGCVGTVSLLPPCGGAGPLDAEVRAFADQRSRLIGSEAQYHLCPLCGGHLTLPAVEQHLRTPLCRSSRVYVAYHRRGYEPLWEPAPPGVIAASGTSYAAELYPGDGDDCQRAVYVRRYVWKLLHHFAWAAPSTDEHCGMLASAIRVVDRLPEARAAAMAGARVLTDDLGEVARRDFLYDLVRTYAGALNF